MFEPQDHPNDMDERGIPRRPYDSAGWTLAYQMGVKFDRLFDDVTGAFKEIEGLATPVPGTISGTAAAGYLLSPAINDAFTIANRVLKANGEVFRLGAPMTRQRQDLSGRRVLRRGERDRRRRSCRQAAQELGVNMDATGARAGAGATKLAPRAHRAVGHADRLDAVGLDALPARALRVPVHRRLRRRLRRHRRCGRSTTSSSCRRARRSAPAAVAARRRRWRRWR